MHIRFFLEKIIYRFMKITKFWRRVLMILLSMVFLSMGWWGSTGLTLLVALIPLLIISCEAENSRRGWWSTFGWALATFVGWNLMTIWWIGYATPIGVFAATLFSTLYSMVAFMTFHTISKRAPKALAYTLLVSLWIALEYFYTYSDFSWPWLLLGNGFSNDIWAVQWYEYTGIFGGSLWVLLSNILLFEAWRARRWSKSAVVVTLAPIALSAVMFLTFDEGEREQIEVSVVQPNVDAYKKFDRKGVVNQELNLTILVRDASATSDLIVMPETTIPRYYDEGDLDRIIITRRLRDTMKIYTPEATLIAGANLTRSYIKGEQSETAHSSDHPNRFYDVFNSAISIEPYKQRRADLRHKVKLVIGVENTPTWIFKIFDFFVIDLGGVAGQLGRGTTAEPFDVGETKVGTAICYEALYGDFYSEFVRNGAEVMTIISNDGWWEDTLGHKLLYSFSSLRAIESRRAIARSANTGTSGFIDARGVSIESLGWEREGVITETLNLRSDLTIYTRWGDFVARIAILVAGLSLLYYIGYRARRRDLLVD